MVFCDFREEYVVAHTYHEIIDSASQRAGISELYIDAGSRRALRGPHFKVGPCDECLRCYYLNCDILHQSSPYGCLECMFHVAGAVIL